MGKLTAPHRFDIVGSFLRPEPLKVARADFKAGKITKEQLTEVENQEIEKLIKKQKEVGLHVITDGEFRRAYWHLDFMWGFNGIEEIELAQGYLFHGEETAKGSIAIVGKITGENHPFIEHFKFVQQFADDTVVARQTIPAPAQLVRELYRGENTLNTEKHYPVYADLHNDIVTAYKVVINDLYNAGCRNIQFDDCTWSMLCDDYFRNSVLHDIDINEEISKMLDINNAVFEGAPEDLVFTTHTCRGNYHSTYAAKGGYDTVAPRLFGESKVHAFYLEYDDERSGNFDPLKFVAEDKKIVLGLVTTKSPVLEDKNVVLARIKEATKHIPLERLYLSPQCGFASCEIGNILTEEQQWAKLRLLKQISEEVWGK